MVEAGIQAAVRSWKLVLFWLIATPMVAFGIGVWSQSGPAVRVLSTTNGSAIVPSDEMLAVTWVYDRRVVCPAKIYRWLRWDEDQVITPQQMAELQVKTNHRIVEHDIALTDLPAPMRLGRNIVTMLIPIPKGTPPGKNYHLMVQKESECGWFPKEADPTKLIEGPGVQIGPPANATILVPN